MDIIYEIINNIFEVRLKRIQNDNEKVDTYQRAKSFVLKLIRWVYYLGILCGSKSK